MQNNALYLQLKQAAINGGYTIGQAEDITKAQMESIVGTSISDNFYANMKAVLVGHITDEAEEIELSGLKNQLIGGNRQWLLNHFPNAEIDRGKESEKKYIKIWLDGKPEVVDE